jgi:hypothetical protein
MLLAAAFTPQEAVGEAAQRVSGQVRDVKLVRPPSLCKPSALSPGEGRQDLGSRACPLRARTEETPRTVTVPHG